MKKTELKLYVDICLIIFYLAVMLTGFLRTFKMIPCYWHSVMVFYLTILIVVHLFLNWRQLLGALDKRLNG